METETVYMMSVPWAGIRRCSVDGGRQGIAGAIPLDALHAGPIIQADTVRSKGLALSVSLRSSVCPPGSL